MGLDSSIQISKLSSVQVARGGREQLVGCREITLTARLPSQSFSFTALASLPLPLLSQQTFFLEKPRTSLPPSRHSDTQREAGLSLLGYPVGSTQLGVHLSKETEFLPHLCLREESIKAVGRRERDDMAR